MGDWPRGGAIARQLIAAAVVTRTLKKEIGRPDPDTLLRIAGGRTPAGESSKYLCGRQLSTPAGRPRQPRTNTRECGSQPAYQSLITVVSAVLSPALRSSHTAFTFADLRGGGAVVSKSLDDEHQRY